MSSKVTPVGLSAADVNPALRPTSIQEGQRESERDAAPVDRTPVRGTTQVGESVAQQRAQMAGGLTPTRDTVSVVAPSASPEPASQAPVEPLTRAQVLREVQNMRILAAQATTAGWVVMEVQPHELLRLLTRVEAQLEVAG